MHTYQQLVNELEGLVSQVTGVVGRLSESALPSTTVSAPRREQLSQLLRASEQRATLAEAKLVKFQQRLERDAQQSQTNAQELNRLAFQDPLTGLANANLLTEHLEKSVSSLSARQRILIIVVDVDHFSVVNQMLGHEHGDELLVRVSERLHGLMNDTHGAVGRLSEDEFALILTLPLEGAADKARELGQTIRSSFSTPFMLQGQKIPLTVSQGGCLGEGGDSTGRELLQKAQTALVHAKRNGRNQFHLYSPDFERRLRRDSTIEFQLGFALDEDELYLEYLPIIWQDELPGGVVRGRLIGVEALLRWRHRTEGVLTASDFIEAAERAGRMVAIGERMFETACRDFASWKNAGADLYLNFNLSGRELLEPEWAARACTIAQRYSVPHDRLTFEFSETTASLDEAMVEDSLLELRKKGFSLALDHFGSGVSSLRRLSHLQFLKLSPSLLQGDRGLVPKALSIAGGLGLVTVGVGVETAEEARFLLRQGCPSVQGFYFSRPLDAKGVMELYRSQPSWKV